MTDDQTAQILADADELEFTFGSQYPAGSSGRTWFHYFAETLRRNYSMSDDQKIELTLKVLERAQPCTKEDLVERMDFSRDEGRRIIDLGIQAGMIEPTQEPTNGRPRILLQIP